MKKITAVTTLVLTTIITFLTCSDNGVDPKPDKTPREFSWTVDTVEYEGSAQTLMRSIWASSADDVYICGHNSGNRGSLWHYDGSSWKDVDIFTDVELGPVSTNFVHGISSNNVWVVGSRDELNQNPPPNILSDSFIIQYDGSKWIEHKVGTESSVLNVFANRADDVWACGFDGIVYHFNGNSWELDSIKVSLLPDDEYFLKSIVVYNSTPFAIGIKVIQNGLGRTEYFFKKENNNWAIVDTFNTGSQNQNYAWGSKALYVSSFNKLFSYGLGGVYQWEENNWNNIFSGEKNLIGGFFENKEANMIAFGNIGDAYHFDGNTWARLEAFNNENSLFTGVWMNNNEAFIIGETLTGFPQKTVVWHGK